MQLAPTDHDLSTSSTPPNEIPMPQVLSPKVHESRIQRAAGSVKQRRWCSRQSVQGTGEPTMDSGHTSEKEIPRSQDRPSDTTADVASPRTSDSFKPQVEDVPKAGEASVYAGDWVTTIRRTGEQHFLHLCTGQIRRASRHDPRARVN